MDTSFLCVLVSFVFTSRVSAWINLKYLTFKPFRNEDRKVFTIRKAVKNNVEDHNFFDDSFDMEHLHQRISQQVTSYSELFDTNRLIEIEPSCVHIIVFNPDTRDEGVHTIEFPKGSGHNVVLAFESKYKCETFIAILKNQNFFEPKAHKMKLAFLKKYCDSLGVSVQVVPECVNIRPPKQNVKNLGLNPVLKQEKDFLKSLFNISPSNLDAKAKTTVVYDDGIGAWQ